jgi:hypothetical protein
MKESKQLTKSELEKAYAEVDSLLDECIKKEGEITQRQKSALEIFLESELDDLDVAGFVRALEQQKLAEDNLSYRTTACYRALYLIRVQIEGIAPVSNGEKDSTKEQSASDDKRGISDKYIGDKVDAIFKVIGRKLDPAKEGEIAAELEPIIDKVYHDGFSDAHQPVDDKCGVCGSDIPE